MGAASPLRRFAASPLRRFAASPLRRSVRRGCRYVGTPTSAVAGVLALVALFGVLRFGSVGAGFAYLGGERVIISPRTASCSFRQIGGTMTVPGSALDFQIHNATDEPVQLIGATSSCSCLSVVSGIPTLIPPAGVATISAVVNKSRVPSSRNVRLAVLTDSPESPTLDVSVSIQVQ